MYRGVMFDLTLYIAFQKNCIFKHNSQLNEIKMNFELINKNMDWSGLSLKSACRNW